MKAQARPAGGRIDFNNLNGREVKDERYRTQLIGLIANQKTGITFAAIRSAVPALAGWSDDQLVELLQGMACDVVTDAGRPVYRSPADDPAYVPPEYDLDGTLLTARAAGDE